MRKELEMLIGEWSTVRDDLMTVIKEFVDENIDCKSYDVEDFGDGFGIAIEDEDDEDEEFFVEVECAGSTWYITRIR